MWLRRTAVALAGLVICGCTSATGAGPATSGMSGATIPLSLTSAVWDWPSYHRDQAHTGFAPATPPAGRMRIAWTRRLDGAVYGQPLALGGLVIAATENDSIYGLDRVTGKVRWRAHVGTPVPLSALPCGDIGPLGITGTPAFDPATGLIYALAETTGYQHILVGVTTSGHVAFRRNVPTPDGHPRFDQQRPALTITAGRVYVAFGGLEGDCGPYRGSVVGVPVSGRGRLVSYMVPTVRAGGIWAAGGPAVGPGGTIYVGVGNGAATIGTFDGSDSVTALSPLLRPIGIFAPASWASDNANDADLGAMAPALLPSKMVLAVGKNGNGYLLNAPHLGGVAGQVATAPVCAAFGGAAVRGTVAYVPCVNGGLAAVDTAGRRLTVLWRGPPSAAGSPVIGGGVVWVADWGPGTLYQIDPASGQVRRQISLGSPLPHFASPSLSGPLALTGTLTGVVAVRGA